MAPTLYAVVVLLAASGVFRAFHEAPLHDPDCGLNKWACERFAVRRPRLHQWLDSRYSSLNKYRFAEGKPAWVAWLLKGPLVGVTDFWHLSYTVSNFCYDLSFGLVLSLLGIKTWLILGLVLLDTTAFEPFYTALRNYKK